MIRSLYHSPGKPIRKDIHPREFQKLTRDRRGLLWVDFIEEPPETCLPILQGFGFHPLAITMLCKKPILPNWMIGEITSC